ncbi:MAG: hypothetical protein ACK5LK_05330, partial [Chthoniobacterales bacterium]
RPPYAGTDKPIYRAGDLKRDLLPNLSPVASTPDWEMINRFYERPWLDHIDNWLSQHTAPGLNQPNYGREFSRLTSIAALMLLLDAPKEEKEKLLISYVQLGIDLHGLAANGRQWFSDGGHWQGRKWPILFASLMLDDEALRTFPEIDLKRPVYAYVTVDSSTADPKPTTVFQEDLDTYYGKGGDGQSVLFQLVYHTGPKFPHEETPFEEYDKGGKFLNGYLQNNSFTWSGAALAALLLKAKATWNHDAYFDYVDRWMGDTNRESRGKPHWLPRNCSRTVDLFLEEMWDTYRTEVPEQPGGATNLKWVWNNDKRSGHFEDTPPPSENP